jgi:hypothetical protein
MRTALCWTASCRQARFRLWIGYMAIGLAVVVGVVPASFAQNLRVVGHGKPAGTGIEAEGRLTQQGPGSNSGVSVAVPIGRVWVDPELVDGDPSYVRRTTASEGMTIVEVSTTPFMPVLRSNEASPGVAELRPDQPASW